MKSKKVSIQDFLRCVVSWCMVLSMVLPMATQALNILSCSEHGNQVMTLDQQEESQKEEQQEDNTKDEKIQTRLISAYDRLVLYASTHALRKTWDAASDFILEIPIPPPQRG